MRIITTVQIRRPVDEVFAFVTTPGNWPRWHPSSLGVTGAADHPLDVGEEVIEQFRVAGQHGTAVWTVRECQAPRRWVIDGAAENSNRATITYTLTPTQGGTTFERELVFTTLPTIPLESQEPFRRQVEAESAEALRRLQAVLEGEGGCRG
jgi:uncharacterized protein YndB with AHSA1/START domain